MGNYPRLMLRLRTADTLLSLDVMKNASTPFRHQVVVDETLSASTGPHEDAPGILQHLPPYSVAAVVRVAFFCYCFIRTIHTFLSPFVVNAVVIHLY